MCFKKPTALHRYKYSMRNFTKLETCLVIVSSFQLISGVALLVINSVLFAVEHALIWDYWNSESMFGQATQTNLNLITCALFVLGLTLFCCGIFGLCGVIMWQNRNVFIYLYIFSILLSFLCVTVVLYVLYFVVQHQQDRMERFKDYYSTIVFKDYTYDVKKREYFNHVQKNSQCCGYLFPSDWISAPNGYLPASCCRFTQLDKCRHLGIRIDLGNLTHALEEAWEMGCFTKQQHLEVNTNLFAHLFYGCIAGLTIVLQTIGLIAAVVYRLTNFSVVMRPTYSTHL